MGGCSILGRVTGLKLRAPRRRPPLRFRGPRCPRALPSARPRTPAGPKRSSGRRSLRPARSGAPRLLNGQASRALAAPHPPAAPEVAGDPPAAAAAVAHGRGGRWRGGRGRRNSDSGGERQAMQARCQLLRPLAEGAPPPAGTLAPQLAIGGRAAAVREAVRPRAGCAARWVQLRVSAQRCITTHGAPPPRLEPLPLPPF